ncbi:hypothetical protein GCM10025786_24910 [Nocardioides caeni]
MLAFVFVRFTDDTAFITWRYGEQLVERGCWCWNPNGPRTEGYTSPVHALLAAVPALVGISTELFFKLVGVLTLAGYLLWTRQLGLGRRQLLVLRGAALLSPVFFIQLFSGIESVPFAVVIAVVFARLYVRGGLGPLGHLLCCLLVLLRPEGLVFALAAVAWALAVRRGRARAVGVLTVGGFAAAYWTARGAFYGSLWPDSLRAATSGGSIADQVETPLVAALTGVVLVALLVLVLVLSRGSTSATADDQTPDARTSRQDMTPLVLALTSAGVLLGYGVFDLTTDFANRYLWQAAFPVAAVVLSRPVRTDLLQRSLRGGDGWALGAVAVTAVASMQSLGSAAASQTVVLAGMVMVIVGAGTRLVSKDHGATGIAALGLVVIVSWMPVDHLISVATYRHRLAAAHEAIGVAIHEAGATVAVADAGALSFAQDTDVVELQGRTNLRVVQGTFGASDLEAAGVGVVVLASSTIERTGEFTATLGQRVAQRWAEDSAFVFFSGPAFDRGYYVNVWVRPDLVDRLQPAIQAAERDAGASVSSSQASILGTHLWDFSFLR